MLYGTKETRPRGALTFFLGLGRTGACLGTGAVKYPKGVHQQLGQENLNEM